MAKKAVEKSLEKAFWLDRQQLSANIVQMPVKQKSALKKINNNQWAFRLSSVLGVVGPEVREGGPQL